MVEILHAKIRRMALFAGGALDTVLVLGTAAYKYIGGERATWLDSLYMVVITIATIGYGEIVDLSQSPGGRVFTMFLSFAGIGIMTYIMMSLTAFVVEGELSEDFRRRKMEKRIEKLRDHYIVCGPDGVGLHVARELAATQRPFVVVDADREKIERLHGGDEPRSFDPPRQPDGHRSPVSAYFGRHVLDLIKLKERLPREAFQSLLGTLRNGAPLPRETADTIASVAREWATSHGATHFTHWFQPMTGLTAEKHDSFIDLNVQQTGELKVLEKFSGSQLSQSEPDASSFPSGGMRSTFEARGYTAWDPASPMFLVESINGRTLCIPSVFVSYHGESLDLKTKMPATQPPMRPPKPTGPG